MNETTDEHRAAKPQPQNISPRLCGEIRFGCGYAAPGSSVLLTRKSFAGRKGFFFAKKNAKDFSLVAALPLCVHRWLRFVQFTQRLVPPGHSRARCPCHDGSVAWPSRPRHKTSPTG